MKQASTILAILAVASQALAAPQLITFGKAGGVGVNFGGYHAAAGLGGALGGGSSGGLFAEAGTPHGQEARAGLGGVAAEGGSAGGLYAGATAGGDVKAAAGLEGAVSGGAAGGGSYSGAHAGGYGSSAGLAGETSNAGSAGFSFSAHKSVGFSGDAGTVKEITVAQPVQVVKTVEVQAAPKKHNEVVYEEETVNYVRDVPPPVVYKTVAVVPQVKTEKVHVKVHAPAVVSVHKDVNLYTEPYTPIVYKEVYVPAPVVHYKPRLHHKAWVGGYLGAEAGVAAPPPTKVVYKQVQVPVVQKRVDVVQESAADANIGVQTGGDVVYRKSINVQHRNPSFFADIFNIPIQTLSAVGKFLGNAAGSTNVSVEKHAHVYAGGESGKDLSSGASVSVQTAPVAKLIDDVFAIPINTLGAVNKFLENNVMGRKRVQVEVENGEEYAVPVKVKGHGRRRAARRQILTQLHEDAISREPEETSS